MEIQLNDNKLPIYSMIVEENDETGVEFISLVNSPAIEVNWTAFSEQKKMYRFEADIEQKKLAGPFVIPDLPIYRSDKQLGEYYAIFTKENVQKISEKFNKNSINKNINYEHKKNSQVDGAYVAENWIIDGESDKSKKYGFDLPQGTWFGIVKIEDQAFWDEYIKTGEVRGFSIEGMLGMSKIKNNKVEKDKFMEFLNSDNYLKNEEFVDFPWEDCIAKAQDEGIDCPECLCEAIKNRSVKHSIQTGLAKTVEEAYQLISSKIKDDKLFEYITKKMNKMNTQKFAEAKAKDGTVLAAEAWEPGKEVYIVADNGDQNAAPDGEYELEDGTIIVVKDKLIAEVKAAPEMADTTATPVDLTPRVNELEATITALADRLAAVEELLKKSADENMLMSKKIEEFSKLPGAKATALQVDKNTSTTPKAQMTFSEKLDQLAQIKKALK